VRNPAKFGGTADHCFIFNDDLNGVPMPAKLDRQWYVELAKKRLSDFGVIV
jgi:DNA polymerase